MSIERNLLKRILATGWLDHELSCEVEELLTQPEQTEQEPVATKLESHQFTAFHVSADDFKKLKKLPTGTRLYTSPKRRPLSDEAICQILLKKEWQGCVHFVRMIEKAHGIGGGE